MKIRDKIVISAIFLFAIFLLLRLVGGVLMPFMVATVFAYLLNPLVEFLCRKTKISRSISAAIILILILSCAAVLLPILYGQIRVFVSDLPSYLEYVVQNIYPQILGIFSKFHIDLQSKLGDIAEGGIIAEKIVNAGSLLFLKILDSSHFIITLLSVVFIMPIFTFYLLRDWKIILKKIDDILPKKYISDLRELGVMIDKSLSAYARGQVSICLILAIYYATSLAFMSLDNGILIGLMTGFLSFIPYVGYGIGLAGSIFVALFQYGYDFSIIAPILLIYLVGQILESNFLVPTLIGKKIALHPAWLIFGVFFFGAIFGFWGVLLSSPLSAIAGVLVRYFVGKFKRNDQ